MNEKIKELQKKIKELEESIFYIDMVDMWTTRDKELYDKYSKELKEVKSLLIAEIAKSVK